MVRAVVFHRHLKVCSQHTRVAHAAPAPHVDRARGVQRGQHPILLLASAAIGAASLLLAHALVERVVVGAVLATLHHRYVRVAAAHWILTATH